MQFFKSSNMNAYLSISHEMKFYIKETTAFVVRKMIQSEAWHLNCIIMTITLKINSYEKNF